MGIDYLPGPTSDIKRRVVGEYTNVPYDGYYVKGELVLQTYQKTGFLCMESLNGAFTPFPEVQSMLREGSRIYANQPATRRLLRRHDWGANLHIERQFYHDNCPTWTGRSSPTATYHQYGPFPLYPKVAWQNGAAGNSFPKLHALDEQGLLLAGTAAINMVKPTRVSAQVGVFLGELREGLPEFTLKARNLKDLINLGPKNFLAASFGVAPAISDLKAMYRTWRNWDERHAQLMKENDNLLHRGHHFDPSTTVTTTVLNPSTYPVFTAAGVRGPGPGELVQTHRETQETWFSGAFSYRLNTLMGYKVPEDFHATVDLVGLNPLDPTLYWNLIRYTWLVDWFCNAGSVISNLFSFEEDGLFMNWGYVMRHETVTDTYTWSNAQYTSTQTLGVERKLRLRASPFGFGLDWPDFSPFQLAVLASLGITRGSGIVR